MTKKNEMEHRLSLDYFDRECVWWRLLHRYLIVGLRSTRDFWWIVLLLRAKGSNWRQRTKIDHWYQEIWICWSAIFALLWKIVLFLRKHFKSALAHWIETGTATITVTGTARAGFPWRSLVMSQESYDYRFPMYLWLLLFFSLVSSTKLECVGACQKIIWVHWKYTS